MKLFPYDNLEYKTDLSEKEIIDYLDYNIKKEDRKIFASLNLFSGDKFSKKYRGYVDQNIFRLQRIPSLGYNGFIPIALGKVESGRNECIIRVKVRPYILIYVLLFLFAFFSLTSIIGGIGTANPTNTQIEIYENEYLRESMRKTLSEDEFANMFKSIESPGLDWTEIFESLLFFIIAYLFVLFIFNYELKIIKEDLRTIIKSKNAC